MNALEVAQNWLHIGIATIPILARSKSPALDSWGEYQERLPTEHELRAWFAGSGYNLAVITGWQGLAVLDFDNLNIYGSWTAGLALSVAEKVFTTYRVSTSRGMHLYFYCQEPARSGHVEACDVKAAGGYVLAPPSVHPSGACYFPIGGPGKIQTIESIDALLPGYAKATEWQAPNEAQMDAFDAAMQPEIKSGAIEAIKARMSIADVLGQSNGNHRRTWLTTCPLHGDKAPSFAVYPDGHFYCFGCGAKGDAISLWAMMHHVTNREAIAALGAIK